jgi:hypothetical protein
MKRLYLLMAALALATALPALGGAQLPVQPADRVRILYRDGSSLTGVVTTHSGDSLEVRSSGDRRWVRQADVAYLERSARRHRRFGRNFAATVGSVAGVTGMISAITWKKCVSNQFLGCLLEPETRGDAFVWGAMLGGVLSVPVGVVLGLAIQYDEWEPAHAASHRLSDLNVRPILHRGVGAAVSFSF